MLSPAHVLPYLQHHEKAVRHYAADYLIGAHDPGPATCDQLWSSIDRYGPVDNFVLLRALTALPQTEQSYARLVQALRTETHEQTRGHLIKAMEALDFGLLRVHQEELLNNPAIPSDTRDHLKGRLEMAQVPPHEVWDRLMSFAAGIEGRTIEDVDTRISDRLVAALEPHHDFAGGRATDAFRNAEEGSWREWFCIEVIGATRYRPAIPMLIESLETDNDTVPIGIAEALVRMGDADVIRQLEEFVVGKRWLERLAVIEPMERIKLPESEAALRRVLASETDPELKAFMAQSLCMLCPTGEGFDEACWIARSELYDPEISHLREMLRVVSVLTGRPVAGAENWHTPPRGAAGNLFTDVTRVMEQLSGRLSTDTPAAAEGEIRVEGPRASRPGLKQKSGTAAAQARPAPALAPLRSAAKPGRNDPCPCGSGKKYKKCCMR